MRQHPEHSHLHNGSTDYSRSEAARLSTHQTGHIHSEQQHGQEGSAVGRQLIDTLLQENGELRSRLADAEVSCITAGVLNAWAAFRTVDASPLVAVEESVAHGCCLRDCKSWLGRRQSIQLLLLTSGAQPENRG